MKRRRALATLAAMAAGAALPTLAQSPGTKRVAVIGAGTGQFEDGKASFPKAFEANGFVPGRNLELRWYQAPLAGGMSASSWDAAAAKLAGEAVAARPDCIVALSAVWVRHLQGHSRHVPIVANVADPVGQGFARSLARPDGNVTGMHDGSVEISVKVVQMLRRVVPDLGCIAWIGSAAVPEFRRPFEEAVRGVGLRVQMIPLEDGGERVRRAIAGLRGDGCLAAYVIAADDAPILAEAVRHRIATATPGEAAENVLLAYDAVRRAEERSAVRLPAIASRILRGERPEAIPFDGPSRYRLSLNLKTAARIGLAVPPDVLVLADGIVR